MPTQLKKIASYLTHFTESLAAITGVDIEVIDTDSIRVAGTGIYAESIDQSVKTSGQQIYNHALTRHETVFVDDPLINALCQSCTQRAVCKEKLTFCTPIICAGEVIGLIGLVCFTDADRDRIVTNRDVYIFFFRQMADAIARVAENEITTQKLRQSMEMLLKVTNSDTTCVLVLDARDHISFINDAASRELGIRPGEYFQSATIADTGDSYSGMGEFEIRIDDGPPRHAASRHIVLGRLLAFSQNDPLYRKALVFDSKLRLAEFFSNQQGVPTAATATAGIVGDSPSMLSLKEQVRKIASTSSTVLVTGESGTGKEMFARAIHAASARRDHSFIALNCGAIPDTLLESELFGYVGGAFTGASPGGRMGKFELADQGVLFLDEISSMPLYLQVKLLRVLQERSFSRLGSNKTVSVDIRIIAATNEKIPDLIAQRMFREDLYYRLNVIPLDIPPLRERVDDIPVLAEYFLERYCRLFDKTGMVMSSDLLERLMRYSWPGNIREFENCIEYMVNMHSGVLLDCGCLPEKLKAARGTAPVDAPAAAEEEGVIPLRITEMREIDRALNVFGSTSEGKRRAADALGISTATLYRKLKTGVGDGTGTLGE